MNEPFWYWAALVGAILLFVLVLPLCSWLESRNDRDLWDDMFGGGS